MVLPEAIRKNLQDYLIRMERAFFMLSNPKRV